MPSTQEGVGQNADNLAGSVLALLSTLLDSRPWKRLRR